MNGARQNLQINDAMRTDIANSVLCWLATVDADGTPNVTPKEISSSYGDDRISRG
ncbi:pyridoxamine 5'-phosphate oxidase family protein [uncultured Agrobacterium sp.]|uniref:pyridoxamine 5'-phosphate oxidase family protein n=1 Tax=uncultured Agrobacterium sp. TaxID=157277 RepID=UPI0025E75195|nr:pyridoxamine 5'-phosphate oxidase family protein [uncultured Agrobacterium sp.]